MPIGRAWMRKISEVRLIRCTHVALQKGKIYFREIPLSLYFYIMLFRLCIIHMHTRNKPYVKLLTIGY